MAKEIIVNQGEATLTDTALVAVRDGAKTKFQTDPVWYAWSPEEMEQYVQDNVTDLASAKLALKKMAFLLGILADRAFPERR